MTETVPERQDTKRKSQNSGLLRQRSNVSLSTLSDALESSEKKKLRRIYNSSSKNLLMNDEINNSPKSIREYVRQAS
jgi:hypothetical protein